MEITFFHRAISRSRQKYHLEFDLLSGLIETTSLEHAKIYFFPLGWSIERLLVAADLCVTSVAGALMFLAPEEFAECDVIKLLDLYCCNYIGL